MLIWQIRGLHFQDVLDWQRFPACCGTVISLHILLRQALRRLLHIGPARSLTNAGSKSKAISLLASFIASWVGLTLFSPLGTTQGPTKTESKHLMNSNHIGQSSALAYPVEASESWDILNERLDLTLFMVTRAVDALVVDTWRSRSNKDPTHGWAFLTHVADSTVFVLCSGTIMWNWFVRALYLSTPESRHIVPTSTVGGPKVSVKSKADC